jgi:hypothetical protein
LLRRAAAFFTASGIDRIERVLTDQAWPYRKSFARQQTKPLPTSRGRQTHPCLPATTARSNASTAPCATNGPTCGPTPATPNAPTPWRPGALADFLHTYNHHRCHTALLRAHYGVIAVPQEVGPEAEGAKGATLRGYGPLRSRCTPLSRPGQPLAR